MAAIPTARSPRPAASPRRVVLTHVPRRDAAQRLSLAFGLLARAAHAEWAAAGAATPSQPPSTEAEP
jgi:hypothetical protein